MQVLLPTEFLVRHDTPRTSNQKIIQSIRFCNRESFSSGIHKVRNTSQESIEDRRMHNEPSMIRITIPINVALGPPQYGPNTKLVESDRAAKIEKSTSVVNIVCTKVQSVCKGVAANDSTPGFVLQAISSSPKVG